MLCRSTILRCRLNFGFTQLLVLVYYWDKMCLTLRFLGTEMVVSICSAGNRWVTFRKAMASFGPGCAHQMLFASLAKADAALYGYLWYSMTLILAPLKKGGDSRAEMNAGRRFPGSVLSNTAPTSTYTI